MKTHKSWYRWTCLSLSYTLVCLVVGDNREKANFHDVVLQ